MKNKYNILLIFGLLAIFFSSCNTAADNLALYKQQFNLQTLTAEQAASILHSKDTSSFLFIDIRNPHQFRNGHLSQAVNIPARKADDEQYQKFWKSEKIKILYGNNAADATAMGYWAILNGYKNIFVILGGYQYIQKHLMNSYSPYSGIYGDEQPLFDYAKTITELKSQSNNNSNTEVVPAPAAPQVNIPKTNQEPEGGGCE